MNHRHKIIERAERMTDEESRAMHVNENGSRVWHITCSSADVHNRPDLGGTEKAVYHYMDGTSVEINVRKPGTISHELPLPDLPEGLVWNVTDKGEFKIARRNESLGEPPE